MEPMLMSLAQSGGGSIAAPALEFDVNNIFMDPMEFGTCDGDGLETPAGTSGLPFSGLKPSIGMTFDSWEQGEEFYRAYADHAGFWVRTGSQKIGEGGVPSWKRFVCTREGYTKEKKKMISGPKEPKKRVVNVTRCGCEAMIGFKRRADGKYEVARFVESHAHQPTSPRKTRFIKSNIEREVLTYVPICEDNLKPSIGMTFDSWEHGEEFYKIYALHVGFLVRTGSQKIGQGGLALWKRFGCSREGYRKEKKKVTAEHKKPKRNVKLTRCGCEAMIGFKRKADGKYEVARFVESHTHELVSPSKKKFIKVNREVASEGQVFIDVLKRKQSANPTFFFDYELDDMGKLKYVFWADITCRKNYASFGDVVSCDSAYGTNQYGLVFIPFTGVNRHKSCVTFGAAFMANGNIGSYIWLFQTFLKAMGGVSPKLIITDEDLSMKSAITDVFATSKHRVCLSHILRKLPEIISPVLNSNTDFNSQFKLCLWESETPQEFESKWSSMVADFGLENNPRFCEMYEQRQSWIPAYFEDLALGGILRTTSRSDSENAFFCHFSNERLNFLEFWLRFEIALEEQRYRELLNDNIDLDLHRTPIVKTPWGIESYGRHVYTQKIFSLFQDEVVAARDNCDVKSMIRLGEVHITGIGDDSGKIREVCYDTCTKVARCSCRMFESVGIPCSHIIVVLKGEKHSEILKPLCTG